VIIETIAELEIAELGRPDWDHYFINMAEAASMRGDCRRRQVGCVIVDENFRILAAGYNGAPPGRPGCLAGHCPRGLLDEDQIPSFSDYDRGPGKCISLHAEANALLYAGREARGGTAYVTYKPCPTCEKLLEGAGIRRVVVG
jgi:dCMP deaminase